jgi:hypothetical protein
MRNANVDSTLHHPLMTVWHNTIGHGFVSSARHTLPGNERVLRPY